MRGRSVLMFAAGFASGVLALTVLLWQSGSLRPGSAAPPAAAPASQSPSAERADRMAEPPARQEPQPAAPGAHPLEVPPARPAAPENEDLAQRQLIIPVKGIRAEQLVDTFNEARGSGKHEAIDIMAAGGTPVIAAGDGTVVKLFHSERGGLTVYQFDDPQIYCYYYAHLSGYAAGLKEGARLRKGELVGYVGSSGDASPQAPHLHFAIFKLGPEKQWWKGIPINPFPFLNPSAR